MSTPQGCPKALDPGRKLASGGNDMSAPQGRPKALAPRREASEARLGRAT
ncbi:MAG TPA: hypothetical protein VFQ55_01150 [Casimicrobiaceae bacterium]|nr:hypothetical protein [Casimicrobiaceae bacterium]